jgi:MFS family permease
MKPVYTGLVFVIDGGMYTLFAPLWGRICDNWIRNPKWITLIGCCLTFTGFLFVGPASFLPFPPTLVVTCLGLAVHGLGMGASCVSSYILAIQEAKYEFTYT